MPQPLPIDVLNGPTIPSGSAFSDVIAVGSSFIVGLVTPEEWTPAVVTVLVSADGDNFFDLIDPFGQPFLFNAVPASMINVDHEHFLMAAFIRLRSGTRDKPVEQEATRRFFLVVRETVALVVGQLPLARPTAK